METCVQTFGQGVKSFSWFLLFIMQVWFEMKNQGITPNAVTYGYYNRVRRFLPLSTWPSGLFRAGDKREEGGTLLSSPSSSFFLFSPAFTLEKPATQAISVLFTVLAGQKVEIWRPKQRIIKRDAAKLKFSVLSSPLGQDWERGQHTRTRLLGQVVCWRDWRKKYNSRDKSSLDRQTWSILCTKSYITLGSPVSLFAWFWSALAVSCSRSHFSAWQITYVKFHANKLRNRWNQLKNEKH